MAPQGTTTLTGNPNPVTDTVTIFSSSSVTGTSTPALQPSPATTSSSLAGFSTSTPQASEPGTVLTTYVTAGQGSTLTGVGAIVGGIAIGAPFEQTEIIPLTTFFQPPASCEGTSAFEQAALYFSTIDSPNACYPESWARFQVSAKSYYSPGVCPASYRWQTVSAVYNPDGEPVTLAVCCPGNLYGYTTDLEGSTYCYFGPTLGPSTVTGAYGLPISVAWREQDLPSFQPPSAPVLALRSNGFSLPAQTSLIASAATNTTSPSTSRTAHMASTLTTNADATAPAIPGNDKLSKGAAAGTGVGVSMAGLAVIAILWWYIRRQRRARQPTSGPDQTTETEDSTLTKAEQDDKERYEVSGQGKPAEAAGRSIAELEGGWQAPELGDDNSRPDR